MGQRIKDALRAIKDIATRFASYAGQLVSSVTAHPLDFLNTLLGGVTGAVRDFFTGLTNGDLEKKFFEWLGGPSAVAAFHDFASNTDIQGFLLKLSGLTWGNVVSTLRQGLGGGNLAAGALVDGLLAGYDQTNPAALLQFLTDLPGKLQNLAGQLQGFDPSSILSLLPSGSDLLTAATQKLTDVLATVPARIAALFAPGLGTLKGIYTGLMWVLDNADQIGSVLRTPLASMTHDQPLKLMSMSPFFPCRGTGRVDAIILLR